MGREFNDLFNEWSQTYDDTITGMDPEYAEVFSRYDEILDYVADQSTGNVLEFGVGTGNLTMKLQHHGLQIIAIDPSEGMRRIARKKLPGVAILDGDFLDFPKHVKPVDTIVSTYAFHHLTDLEKAQAIEIYSRLLQVGGKIVFGDTVFESEGAKTAMIKHAKEKKFHRLAEDLKREYYATIPYLQDLCQRHGFSVTFTKWNSFVWVMEAEKQSENRFVY